jgi:hypothetical protein
MPESGLQGIWSGFDSKSWADQQVEDCSPFTFTSLEEDGTPLESVSPFYTHISPQEGLESLFITPLLDEELSPESPARQV